MENLFKKHPIYLAKVTIKFWIFARNEMRASYTFSAGEGFTASIYIDRDWKCEKWEEFGRNHGTISNGEFFLDVWVIAYGLMGSWFVRSEEGKKSCKSSKMRCQNETSPHSVRCDKGRSVPRIVYLIRRSASTRSTAKDPLNPRQGFDNDASFHEERDDGIITRALVSALERTRPRFTCSSRVGFTLRVKAADCTLV